MFWQFDSFWPKFQWHLLEKIDGKPVWEGPMMVHKKENIWEDEWKTYMMLYDMVLELWYNAKLNQYKEI